MRNDVYSRTLQRAADIVGGLDKLRARIAWNVSAKRFKRWIDGDTEPPPEVFLDAVDIVIQQKLQQTFDAAHAQRARPQSGKKE